MKLRLTVKGLRGGRFWLREAIFEDEIRIALRITALFRRVFGVASKNLGRRSAEMDGS